MTHGMQNWEPPPIAHRPEALALEVGRRTQVTTRGSGLARATGLELVSSRCRLGAPLARGTSSSRHYLS
ncbi:UNVERIFIED_CONTAM: hypothetical protein Sradi_1508700 [Sesamum radiatum]|uniref:Uncharacterized protein n=1 Tax=Sesamum radiatum TaxID=300843 RepID=A0AAW2U9N9_SESRA